MSRSPWPIPSTKHRLMVRAADELHERVVQVGQWQRSGAHWQEAMDYCSFGSNSVKSAQ